MTVQATWSTDSPLRQIPHFSNEVISRCNDENVISVDDILNLEDDERNRLLNLDSRRMRDVAKFCNAYPSKSFRCLLTVKSHAYLTRSSDIDVSFDVQDAASLTSSQPINIKVNLERSEDDDEKQDHAVVAPLYPFTKTEGWWTVISEPLDQDFAFRQKGHPSAPSYS